MLKLLAVFGLIMCLVTPACAGDAASDARDVLRANGYDGIWSMDCARSPLTNIPRIDWVVPDHGPVQQWVDIGRGYYLEGVVAAAAVTSDGRFTLSVRSLSGSSWVRTTMRVGNKIRMMEASSSWQGRTTTQVRNGHDLRTDQETPTIEKCEDAPALTS